MSQRVPQGESASFWMVGGQKRLRFYALTRILGVSGDTLYRWRRGSPHSPALEVVVERSGSKNVVWVEVATLRRWLGDNRPGLVEKLDKYEESNPLPIRR